MHHGTPPPPPHTPSATRWLLLLALLLLGSTAPPEQPALPAGRYRVAGVSGSAARNTVTASGAAIDWAGPAEVLVSADARAASRLAALGFALQPLPPAPLAVDPAFHTYAGMLAEVQRVAAKRPALVQLSSIGSSYEGRDLLLARVAGPGGPAGERPEALLVGHYHAREHLTVEMLLAALHLLADNYGQPGQERITRLLDQRVVWLVFDLNPDGGVFDTATGTYQSWRKNREPNDCLFDSSSGTGRGTDPNRNHSYGWGRPGSSDDACSEIYRGPAPASAPEVAALERFVRGRVVGGVQRITVAVSFHTYGERILWPYGYTDAALPPDMEPDDYAALAAMGQAMARTNGYQAMQSSQLYTTSGDFADWAYGEQRIFAYTFEMYPADFNGSLSGFYPPGSVIARETARNSQALLLLLEQAACPYLAAGTAQRHCRNSARFRPPQLVWLPSVAR